MNRVDWKTRLDLIQGHFLAFEQQAGANGRAHGTGSKEGWNPLRPLFSFADAHVVIAGFSTQFGRFFEPMCESVTQTLIQLERRGTGRVSLSSFHASTLAGNKYFTESAEYLQQ